MLILIIILFALQAYNLYRIISFSKLKKESEGVIEKYKGVTTLAKIPETMAAAISPFGGPVGAAMAYQGASAIPGIYAQTMAAYPQIQVPGYSAQQYRYFQ